MKVGITGHRERPGIDWAWVTSAIREALLRLRPDQALSSLAVGADQALAEIALELKIPLLAVVPMDDYERFFEGAALDRYRQLLGSAAVVRLRWEGDSERAFLEAGKFIVTHCDLLLAVWDGEHSEGLGGTGDVVTFARNAGRRILHINPCTETVFNL